MNKTKQFLPKVIAIAGLGIISSYSSIANAAQCEHVIQNEWDRGFVAEIQITNNSNTAIEGWQVNWSYNNAVSTSTWNAVVSGNNPYTASNLSWNSTIYPGQSIVFGIQGDKNVIGSAAPSIQVTGAVCGNSPVVDPDTDSDNDGVNDDIDQCPNTLPETEVDLVGCALPIDIDTDTDNDGVNNDIDQCPNTLPETDVDAFGCALPIDIDTDTDLDGVNNDIDQCPNTLPETEVDLVGCALPIDIDTDTDLDGVNNDIDQCPNTLPETEVDLVGCALPIDIDTDTDLDGVNNDIDQCPNTPVETSVDAVGCALAIDTDTDNDGVNDDIDQCPNSPAGADVNALGCRDTGTVGKGAGYDNPWVGGNYYIDPIWAAKAAAEPGGEAIANYNTAVWMDRIGAIAGPEDGDGMGLRDHLDNAVVQGVDLIMVVVYDLPNRDCAALASSGELRIADGDFVRYQEEYIAPYAAILADPAYKDLRIVTIIEVDSLPNLITNLNYEDCAEANGPGGYRDGITHALNAFSKIPNVYSYVDIAHSGWLGWSDNFAQAVSLIAEVVENTDAGWDSVSGFVSNSANYTPVEEPYLPDPTLTVGGLPIRSADFYEWNNYFEEKDFVQDWREAMIAQGAPESIGMLIDTARNGWGGSERPTAASTSTDINEYVNESRIDRRNHRGNWCNQPGGVGFKPWPNPYEGIDAFVWVKPQGESDGISDPNFAIDPNDLAKRHDPMCNPIAPNRDKPSVTTGAMDNAPHAGRWFPEAFQLLVENAYPAANEPAGPPPAAPAAPSDCEGLNASDPLFVADSNVKALVDLRCGPVYVEFADTTQTIFFENTGTAFDVTVEYNGTSSLVSGYFKGISAATTTMKITLNEGGDKSLQVRY